MAFKRTNFNKLVQKKKEYFASTYKFSKKTNFTVGQDVYIIPLGLETGYYETPCHILYPHKVDGQTIGFNGTTFATYIKCTGRDEEGNKLDSLCCKLANKEKERVGSTGQKIITFSSNRVHLPVLILGNSLKEEKKAFPIQKVSILNDLNSEAGLKFAYLDMAASGFGNDIIGAYGKKLKEEGVIDYEMEEDSEEYLDEIRNRLSETVIKVHGVSKQGFNAALREYSFFPFNNPAIASQSPAGEREAIIGYKKNKKIMEKINEFLTLFDVEVDSLIQSWTEKDLQEYYNSAIGVDLKTPIDAKPQTEEKIEIINDDTPKELSDEDRDFLKSELDSLETEETETTSEVSPEDDLQDYAFDTEDEEAFFND